MPRFVVLRHEMPVGSARSLHWDFMVEQDQSLRAWALAEEPAPEREIAAEALADHRLAYLDYEGPVSGNRGQIAQWDRGECEIEESTAERFVITAFGQKLIGRVELSTTRELRVWSFHWR